MRNPVETLNLKIPVPQRVKQIHQAFRAAGEELLLVGGAPREHVLAHLHNQEGVVKDYDLVTGAEPDRVEDILQQSHIASRPVGKSFGIILATFRDEEDFEIATFREDAKTSDGRRPTSVRFTTIDEDADRRDLTCNALYYSLDQQQVLDFHGGIQDLRDGKVRFVGAPAQRLEEDRLRALRYARFFSKINTKPYHQYLVDDETLTAIRNTGLRPVISEERIRDEFLKGLASAIDVNGFLLLLGDLYLLNQVFPKLPLVHPQFRHWTEPELIIAQMYDNALPEEIAAQLTAQKYTSQEVNNVWFLRQLQRFCVPEQIVDFKRALKKLSLPQERLLEYIRLLHPDNKVLLTRMVEWHFPNFSGDDLLQEGFTGKALGDELKRREIELFNSGG